MAELTYNWKRFYRKLGGVLNLSDAGFLVDPDAEYGSALNPDVAPWDTLASIPCLILLGEPGIGKTKAIQSEVDRIKEVPEKSSDRVLNIDLRAFQTDQRLHDRVFASPTMNAWKTDGSRLYLFLDGMDECLMRIDNIASVLVDEFSDLDRERLHLRLACRTAVWPRDFELKLQELWGNDNVGNFELAPLRRADVVEAARVHAVDPPESFIGEIISRNIVPLAIKPVTLEFLLKTRTRPGGMPTTQTALYAEGCRILCEDRRPGRRPGKSSDELPADKRLVIASRIAAATMFCNRDAVWTDVDQGDVPLEDIRITDFVGREAGDEPGPSENQVFQTLDTGLFSSRGIPRIGWAHQTYCEYLAARLLVDGRQSVDTMMSLLLHPDGKVIPQLRETAAWVAALVPEAFQRITSADPMTLLNSEATTGDPNERRELTENLLQLFDSGDLLDLEWGLWQAFPKLQHPTLGDQLRPFINDIHKNVVVRRVAITIAQTCKVASLEPELVSLALSQTDVHELRVSAAFAISQFGGPAAQLQVSALVTDTSGDDPDDDLKGCGLLCGWPQSLTATQLFNTLTGRKIPNRSGLYDSFLRRDIVSELAIDDLATGLAWTERELNCNDSLDPFSRIADEIRTAALGYVSREDVGVALASSTWAWLKANAIFPCPNDKFKSAIREDDSSRRQLISRLIPLGLNDTSFVFYVHQVLISPTDFEWLLARFGEDDSEDVRGLWLNLIQRIFNTRSDEHRIQLATASASNPELQNLFEWFLDPDSAAAAEVRRQREEWERATPQIATRPPLDPPPDERVRNSLLQIESGELQRFIDLSANLSLHPDSVSYQQEERARLSITVSGW